MTKKLSLTPMLVLMAASLAIAGLGWVGLTRGTPSPDSTAQVARGRYLVTAGHCNDCHTPWKMGPQGPAPDMTRLLSGHPEDLKMPAPPRVDAPWGIHMAVTNTAFAGPWGISYAANLTPDLDTGLGAWTEEIFIKAMRTGRHMGAGRPIMPPMPWQNLSHMTDADLKAIFAYLRTIPPIRNRVPDYEPPAGMDE